MDKVEPMYPLFKVAIELLRSEDFFRGLKFLCKCNSCETPFQFLKKLINKADIDVDGTPHDYEYLITKVREYSFNPDTPISYQKVGNIILNILGCIPSEIPPMTGPKESLFSVDHTERDASAKKLDASAVEKLDASASVVFAKIDIDHLCGMAWPRVLYREFRDTTGKLFHDQLAEMDISGIDTIDAFNAKLLPILLNAKNDTIVIIICGFSACIKKESTVCNFILPSQSKKIANVVYNLKNLYKLIDTSEVLTKKRTIIVLLTLPSSNLTFEDTDEFSVQEETHDFYTPLKSTILASSVATISNLRKIVKPEKNLKRFYEALFDVTDIEYIKNRLDRNLFYLKHKVKENTVGKGIFCLLNFDGLKREFDDEIQEKIVDGRNWIFNNNTQFELGYNREDYPDLIKDFVRSLKQDIKEHKIECIVVLIVRTKEWNNKDESRDVYSMILGDLSKEIKEKYNLPIVCIIEDSLLWLEIRKGLPVTDEFKFTEEDARPFEEIVATNPNMYFVLPYSNYGVDLFNELNEPHTRSLRDINEINIRNKEKITGKRQFSKVICQSDKMDFIFPVTKLPRVDT